MHVYSTKVEKQLLEIKQVQQAWLSRLNGSSSRGLLQVVRLWYQALWCLDQADRDSTHSSPRNTEMEICWYTTAKPIFIQGFKIINKFDTTTDGEAASVALIAHTTIWTLFLEHHLASRFSKQRKTAVGDDGGSRRADSQGSALETGPNSHRMDTPERGLRTLA